MAKTYALRRSSGSQNILVPSDAVGQLGERVVGGKARCRNLPNGWGSRSASPSPLTLPVPDSAKHIDGYPVERSTEPSSEGSPGSSLLGLEENYLMDWKPTWASTWNSRLDFEVHVAKIKSWVMHEGDCSSPITIAVNGSQFFQLIKC